MTRRRNENCSHAAASWSAWRASLTQGVEHRERRCPACKHVVGSEQRPRP